MSGLGLVKEPGERGNSDSNSMCSVLPVYLTEYSNPMKGVVLSPFFGRGNQDSEITYLST